MVDQGVLMSRMTLPCSRCKEPLGQIKPSDILHPRPEVKVVYVDHREGTTSFLCPNCGATIKVRIQRIELDRTAS